MFISGLGALFFGLVIGWISYRTLRLTAGTTALSDITTIIGAVGGAAVTALFRSDVLFGLYCVGLAVGFFAYLGYGLASQLASSLTLAMAYTSLANKRYSPGMLLARLSRLLLLARHLPPLLPSPRRLPPLFLSTNHPLKTITRVEGQAILTLNLFCALLNM